MVEDLLFQLLQLLLELVDDREVLIDDEVHDRVEDESGTLPQEMRRRFTTVTHLGVGERSTVSNRHDVARAEESVGLAEGHFAAPRQSLRGAQHHEQRIAVFLDLRPLVGAVSVLDGEVVEAELLLDLPQQILVRLVEADPDELALEAQDLADILEIDGAHALAVGIRHAVDDHLAHDGPRRGRGAALAAHSSLVPSALRLQAARPAEAQRARPSTWPATKRCSRIFTLQVIAATLPKAGVPWRSGIEVVRVCERAFM